MYGLSAKITAKGLGQELALEEVGAASQKKLVKAVLESKFSFSSVRSFVASNLFSHSPCEKLAQ